MPRYGTTEKHVLNFSVAKIKRIYEIKITTMAYYVEQLPEKIKIILKLI